MKPELTIAGGCLCLAVAVFDIAWMLYFASGGQHSLSMLWFERMTMFIGGQLLMCILTAICGEGLAYRDKQNLWCVLANVMLWPLAIPFSFLALAATLGSWAAAVATALGMKIIQPPK